MLKVPAFYLEKQKSFISNGKILVQNYRILRFGAIRDCSINSPVGNLFEEYLDGREILEESRKNYIHRHLVSPVRIKVA